MALHGDYTSLWMLTWWRHQMETFSALLALCAGNSPVTGEFPSQRPVTRSFDVFFDLCLNKRLSKQSWGLWFETPSRSLWRHCNENGKIFCPDLLNTLKRHGPVDSPHIAKGCGAWVFSLMCASTKDEANNRDAGDLRRHCSHYDVTVMVFLVHTRYLAIYDSCFFPNSVSNGPFYFRHFLIDNLKSPCFTLLPGSYVLCSSYKQGNWYMKSTRAMDIPGTSMDTF